MKLVSTLFLFILLSVSTFSQTVNWVSKQGGTFIDQTNDIVTDTSGNIYMVGAFDGTASLDSVNITSYGSNDIFLAKYNKTGACLWAKKAGGTFGDEGRGIALDAAGNVYITGTYGQAGATFGSTFVTSLGGLRNGFVAKYSSNGDVIWVKRMGGSGSSPEPRKVAISGDKVYVAGEFYGAVHFEGLYTVTSTPSGGSNDIFLAQFDTSGAPKWSNRGGDRKDEKLDGLVVDAAGNPIIYGNYDSLTTFNSTSVFAQYLGSTFGHRDLFLVKYSPSGGFFWFKTFGGDEDDQSGGICLDASGNIYTTGNFRTTFISGGVTANNSGTTNTLFLHKMDGNGNPLWVKYSPYPNSIGFSRGLALAFSNNTIVMAGYFGNKYKAGNDNLTGSGENNPLLIRYDTSGTQLWGMFGNGVLGKVSQARAVAIDGNTYYYAGYITGSVTFSGTTITAPGTYADGFICSVQNGSLPPAIAPPTSLTVSSATTTSVQLNWTGTSSEFRVLMKTTATSTSPTDGTVIYEGTALTYNYTGLTPNTPYFITVYGKAAGSNTFSATGRKIAATTVSSNPSNNVVIGFLAGDTATRTFGSSRVRISITGASVSDGNIRVERNTNLTGSTVPVNIDSIFNAIYWTVTSTGLSGGALRYCITIDVSDVWGLMGFLNYHLLKRPQTGAPWEDLLTNSSFTVTLNSPEISVCGLSTFSDFAVGINTPGTGIKQASKSNGLHVYPNPGNSYVLVSVSNASAENLELYNLQGQLVRTLVSTNTATVKIERNELPAGVYLLKWGGEFERIMFTD